MIRLFKVYYPVRTLVLLAVETLIVWVSFVLGTMVRSREDWLLRLNNELFIEGGFLKILAVTAIVLLHLPWSGPVRFLQPRRQVGSDLPPVAGAGLCGAVSGWRGFCSIAISCRVAIFCRETPRWWVCVILTFALFGWRAAYSWLVQQHYFRERVYVLGTGDRAQRLLNGLRQRAESRNRSGGMDGGHRGRTDPRDGGHASARIWREENGVHRVIVAMPDRRGTLPVEELLDLRLEGVKVEEATSWLEKINGRIEVEQLYPSWLIFADGFRFSTFFRMVRRVLNFSVALVGLVLSLPLLPFIALAREAGLLRDRFLPPADGWAEEAKHFTATSFAPCDRMRRPIRARPGRPMTIRASRASESFCARRVSTRFHSFGAF